MKDNDQQDDCHPDYAVLDGFGGKIENTTATTITPIDIQKIRSARRHDQQRDREMDPSDERFGQCDSTSSFRPSSVLVSVSSWLCGMKRCLSKRQHSSRTRVRVRIPSWRINRMAVCVMAPCQCHRHRHRYCSCCMIGSCCHNRCHRGSISQAA